MPPAAYCRCAAEPPPFQLTEHADASGRAEPHPRTPYVALTENGGVAEPQRLTYHAWRFLSAAEFAEQIMFDWFVWWPHQGERQGFRIAEHADPAEYLPYLQGITEVITGGFTAITPAGRLRPG